jgi:glycosyltransferase involved in cell wall biosynthesis
VTRPRFSFVVPVYNEGEGLTRTIDRVKAQTVGDYEVVVVDDAATPSTSAAVERLSLGGQLRRVSHAENRGAAAARNSGIDTARGDVVIFLDGDVEPPPDFLRELDSEYRAGAEAVAVESRVAELGSAVGRYLQAVHELEYPRMQGVGFSQAFSCRREIAGRVRFREDIPGAGSEDGAFYADIRAAGYSCTKRPDIVVDHRLPTSWRGLWRQAKKRGRAIPHADVKVYGRTNRTMLIRRLAASIRAAAGIVLLVPALSRANELARRSPKGLSDRPAFWVLHHVFLIGQRSGELSEAVVILRGARL